MYPQTIYTLLLCYMKIRIMCIHRNSKRKTNPPVVPVSGPAQNLRQVLGVTYVRAGEEDILLIPNLSSRSCDICTVLVSLPPISQKIARA